MTKPITWGILGTGDIARQMAEDLRLVPGAELRAAASRDPERAAAFCALHGIPVHYGSYEALVSDPAIDVVYIATPHVRHCEDALLCFAHGKHVLCEKPVAMNAVEAARMFDAARASGCFLMEAMWTAFFPAIQALRSDIESGLIGNPQLVQANFSYKATLGPESRLFNPALGGGALLDIGIYGVALADMVYGEEPTSIVSSWTAARTGVDESLGLILDYPSGGRLVFSSSLACDAPQEALIVGESGVLHLPHRFSQPDQYIRDIKGVRETFDYGREGYGYCLEARAVTSCVRAGKTECDTVPLSESMRVMRTLDRIRNQWGLRYPSE